MSNLIPEAPPPAEPSQSKPEPTPLKPRTGEPAPRSDQEAEPVASHLPPEPPDTASTATKLRYWAWKYVGTLVMEPNAQGEYVMSLGRASACALLLQAMTHWAWHNADLPESMTQTLWILLGYNLGTKGITVVHQLVDRNRPREPRE